MASPAATPVKIRMIFFIRSGPPRQVLADDEWKIPVVPVSIALR
jgi:hypothetical protein